MSGVVEVMMASALCSVSELRERLDLGDVKVVDASWYMPAAGRDCHAEFLQAGIPGALFFDIDAVCDVQSPLPHMLPTEQQFSQALTSMGITNKSDVVIYDTAGLFSAARVWWMFRVFGHHCVRVLDGGLPAWIESGGELRPSVKVPAKLKGSVYCATFNETFLATKDVLKQNSQTGEYLVLDARPNGRFAGTQPEPRAGLAPGHMPGSKSLPFDELIDAGKLRSHDALLAVFSRYGLDPTNDGHQALITSCGSGVTAAIITLALYESGFGMHKLYDGAWAEWASAHDTTILQGQ